MHNTNTVQSPSSPLLCNHRSCAVAYGAQKRYFVMRMPGKSFCADRVMVLWRTAVVRFVHRAGHLLDVMLCSQTCCFGGKRFFWSVGKKAEPQPKDSNLCTCLHENLKSRCWELQKVVQNCLHLFVWFVSFFFLYNSNIFWNPSIIMRELFTFSSYTPIECKWFLHVGVAIKRLKH
jgi:hypothetical protein